MASTVDGSVVIEVDMNVSDAEKELARLKKRVFKLEDEIGEKSFRRSALSSELVKVRKELKKLEAEEPATLIDGQFADNTKYYKALNDARERAEQLAKEIKAVDDEIEEQNVSLEWTKQRYGEIVKVANELNSVQKSTAENESREVSNQHIADLNHELAQLKQRLAELKKAGYGLGDKEFEAITTKIAAISRELKEYEKNLVSAADAEENIDLSGSAAKRVADEMFQGMADHAAETARWVERLRDELAELEERKHYVRGHYSRDSGRDGMGGYSSRRDSRGRYSRDDGRSEMMEHLEMALDSASDQDRETIKRFMRQLENA